MQHTHTGRSQQLSNGERCTRLHRNTRASRTNTKTTTSCHNVTKCLWANTPQSRPSLSGPSRGNLHGVKASVRYCMLLANYRRFCTQCSSRAQHSPAECLESKSGSSRFRTCRVSDVQLTKVSKVSAAVACAGYGRAHVVQHALEQLQKVLNLDRCCCACRFPGRAAVMQEQHTVNTHCYAQVNEKHLRGCSSICSQMHTSMNLTSSSTLAKTIAQRITSVTVSTRPRYER